MLNDPEWSGWSDNKIARRCAVSDKTVAAHRSGPSSEIPKIDRTVERNGKTYTMNTSAIGKKADDTAEDDMEATEAASTPSSCLDWSPGPPV